MYLAGCGAQGGRMECIVGGPLVGVCSCSVVFVVVLLLWRCCCGVLIVVLLLF